MGTRLTMNLFSDQVCLWPGSFSDQVTLYFVTLPIIEFITLSMKLVTMQ